MYQFSLDWFQDMFTATISGATTLKEQQRRRSVTSSGTVRRSSLQGGRLLSLSHDSEGTLKRIQARAGEDSRSPRNVRGQRKSSTSLDEPIRPETQDPLQLKRHMLDMINRFVYFFRYIASKPLGYRTFPCSTQLSMKFQLLIKTELPINEEVYCLKSLRCCIYHANKC